MILYEQSPPYEADSGLEVPRLLRFIAVFTGPYLELDNPIQSFRPYFPNIYFNIILPCTLAHSQVNHLKQLYYLMLHKYVVKKASLSNTMINVRTTH